jgi:prepilin-type N-terminal cleavage/methylation domain-containing protein
MSFRDRQAGFTLIELMAVVVILAVLAVVAIGAYSKHVRSAHKTEVIADLANISLKQKSLRAVQGHYASTTACEGETCTYPAASAIATTGGPVAWNILDAGYTATGQNGPYFRGGDALHGFDALRFVPEGGRSWCGYATISGHGANAPAADADIPPNGTLSDEIFPQPTAAPYYASDWFYAYALCNFDFDQTYWALTIAHYQDSVNYSSIGPYQENE